MTSFSRGMATPVAMMGLCFLLLAGCPEQRKLGESCISDSECETGFCYGQCLEPDLDNDGDGVLNKDEKLHESDPLDPDSDGDGVDDGTEYGDPRNPRDTDEDGKIDAIEDSRADTDGDCLFDQEDPENDVPNPELIDLDELSSLCVAVVTGVCADNVDAIAVSCTVDDEGQLQPVCDTQFVSGYTPNDICGNLLDDDCDSQTDEPDCDPPANGCDVDTDGDGLCDDEDPDDDGDGVNDDVDCQPLNANVSPNQDELCNGIDDSCSNADNPGGPTVDPSVATFVRNGLADSDKDLEAPPGSPTNPFDNVADAIASGATTIYVAAGSYSADHEVRSDVIIQGSWDCDWQTQSLQDTPSELIGSGAPAVAVRDGATLTARSMRFEGNNSGDVAIASAALVDGAGSTLDCVNCQFKGGVGADESWAVQVQGGTLQASDTRFSAGSGTVASGGVHIVGGVVTLDRSEVSVSEAQSPHVGLDVSGDALVRLEDSDVDVNGADHNGYGIVLADQAALMAVNNELRLLSEAPNTSERVLVDVTSSGSTLLVNNAMRVSGAGAAAAVLRTEGNPGPVSLVNNLLDVSDDTGERHTIVAATAPDLYHNNFDAPSNDLLVLPEGTFGLAAINGCLFTGCDPAKIASNWALDCPFNNGSLPPGSPCRDKGIEPTTAGFPGDPAYTVDKLGTPRDDGFWDIGPIELTGDTSTCTVDADCGSDPCVYNFCANGSCAFPPAVGSEDLDGDGSCNAVDNDADGDGFDASVDDCNDLDPTVFPGAPEVCDGIDTDCLDNAQSTYTDADAIFVVAGAALGGNGTRASPYATIANALLDPNAAARPILVTNGVYAGPLNIDSALAPAGTKITIIGSFSDCDFLPLQPGAPASTLVQVNSSNALFVDGAEVELQNIEFSAGAGADTQTLLLQNANVTLRNGKIGVQPGSGNLGAGVQSFGDTTLTLEDVVVSVPAGYDNVYGIWAAGGGTGTVRLERTIIDVDGSAPNDVSVVSVQGVLEVYNSAITSVASSPGGNVVGLQVTEGLTVVNSLVTLAEPGGADTYGIAAAGNNGSGGVVVNTIIALPPAGPGAPTAALDLNESSGAVFQLRNNAIGPDVDLAARLSGVPHPTIGDLEGCQSCTVDASGNLPIACVSPSGAPDFLLPADSLCLDNGIDPVNFASDPAIDLDISGQTRVGTWDIGPSQGEFTGSVDCTVADDCTDPPGPECYVPVCDVVGACIYDPGPDLDGDGICDIDDPDVDGDGFEPPTDCAPTDPNTFPDAPEVCGDNVINDCGASGGGTQQADPTAAIYVATWGSPGAQGTPDDPFDSIEEAINAAQGQGAPVPPVHIAVGEYLPVGNQGITIQSSESHTLIGGFDDCDWAPTKERPVIKGDRFALRTNGGTGTAVVAQNLSLVTTGGECPMAGAIAGQTSSMTLVEVDITTENAPSACDNIGVHVPQGFATVDLDKVTITTGFGQQANFGIWLNGDSALTVRNSDIRPEASDGVVNGIRVDGGTQVLIDNTAILLEHSSTPTAEQIGLYVNADGVAPVVTDSGISVNPGINANETVAVRVNDGGVDILNSFLNARSEVGTSAAGLRLDGNADTRNHQLINTIIRTDAPSGFSHGIDVIGNPPGTIVMRNNAISSANGTFAALFDGQPRTLQDINSVTCGQIPICSIQSDNNIPDNCPLSQNGVYLPSDSACVGTGTQLSFITYPELNEDIHGDPRPQAGSWDIGPDEVRDCTTATDCVDPADLCLSASCEVGLCNYIPPADTDGDGECDAVDDDDDGDGVPDATDPCPNTPEFGADKDGDGCDTIQDCIDENPSIYPGAPEIACDGVINDCNASGGGGTTAVQGDVYVDINFGGASDGTALAPFTSIQAALDSIAATGGVVVVGVGTYSEGLELDATNGFAANQTFEIRGGADGGCGFEEETGNGSTVVSAAQDWVLRHAVNSDLHLTDLTLTHAPPAAGLNTLQGIVHDSSNLLRLNRVTVQTADNSGTAGSENTGIFVGADGALEIVESSIEVGPGLSAFGVQNALSLLLFDSVVRVPGMPGTDAFGLTLSGVGPHQLVDSVVKVGEPGLIIGNATGINATTSIEMVNTIIDIAGQAAVTQNGIVGFNANVDAVGSAIQLASGGQGINLVGLVGGLSSRFVNTIVAAPGGTGLQLNNPTSFTIGLRNCAFDAATMVQAGAAVTTEADLNACLWQGCDDTFTQDNLLDACPLAGPDYLLAVDAPCGGKGIDPANVGLNLLNQDLDREGEARPIGGQWDIGPDEVAEVVPVDTDNDGIPDSSDSCPNGAATGTDADGDGCMEGPEDCNDQSPLVNNGPGQIDPDCDGIDQDCSDGGYVPGPPGANVVFVNPIALSNGDGSIGAPFDNMADALAATGGAGQDHVILAGSGLLFGTTEAIDIAAASHGNVNSLSILGGRDATCDWTPPMFSEKTVISYANATPLPALRMSIPTPVTVEGFEFDITINTGNAVGIEHSDGTLVVRDTNVIMAGFQNDSMIAFDQTFGQAVLEKVELAPAGASENIAESLGISSIDSGLEVYDSLIRMEDQTIASAGAVGVRIERSGPLAKPIIANTKIRVNSRVGVYGIGVELKGADAELFMANSVVDVEINNVGAATDVKGIWAGSGFGTSTKLDVVHSAVKVWPEASATNIAIHQASDSAGSHTRVFNTLIDLIGGQGIVIEPTATSSISIANNYINAGVPLFAAGAAQGIASCQFSGAISPCGANIDQNTLNPCGLSGPYQYALLPGSDCVGNGLDLVAAGEYSGFFGDLISADFEQHPRPGDDNAVDIGPDESIPQPCANDSQCDDFNPCTVNTCDSGGTGTCNPPVPVTPPPGYYVDVGAPAGGTGEATNPFNSIADALTAIDIAGDNTATIYLGPSDTPANIDLTSAAFPNLTDLTISGGYDAGCIWERPQPTTKTKMFATDAPVLAVQTGFNVNLENVILESAWTFNPLKVVDVLGGTLTATQTEVTALVGGSAGSLVTGVAVSGGLATFIESRIAPGVAENVAGVMVSNSGDLELIRTEINLPGDAIPSMNAIGVLVEHSAFPTNPVRIIESIIRVTANLSQHGYGVQTKASGQALILNSVIEVSPADFAFFTSAAAVAVGDSGDPLSDGQVVIANSALLMPDNNTTGQRAALELQNQAMGEAAKVYNSILSTAGLGYGIYVGNPTIQMNEYGVTHSYIDASVALWTGTANTVDDLNACTGSSPTNCLLVPSGNNFSASGDTCSLSPYPTYGLSPGSPCQDAGAVLSSAEIPAPWDAAVQADRVGTPRCDAIGGGIWDVGPSEAPCP